MNLKQVDRSHYEFPRYMRKARWISVWHQLDEISNLNPGRVLEIGPGPGILKVVGGCFGINVETLDVDADLSPDHLGSVTTLPFGNEEFDVVCAFQMLEHLPYELAINGLKEMLRVSRMHVIISLPDSSKAWTYRIHVPLLGTRHMLVQVPSFRESVHRFDGEHYWEINKRGYALRHVMDDISKLCHIKRTYRVPENPYHRFFILECRGVGRV